MKQPSEFLKGSILLRHLGLTLTYKACYQEFRVNFINGGEATACYTDDLQDAIGTGIAMSKEGKP